MASLLLVAFLFCHGLLGALHQVPDPPGHSNHLVGEHSSHALAGGLCDHLRVCLGHSDYAAALISVLFGMVIGLLLGSPRAWGGLAASRLPGRYFPLLILHPARGPTAPLLQVFRL